MYYALLSRTQLGLRIHPAGHVHSRWRGPNVRRDSMRYIASLIMLLRNIEQTYVQFASSAKLILHGNLMTSSK